MSPGFDNEREFGIPKNVNSRNTTSPADGLLKGCMRIATAEIKLYIERLLKQKLCKVSQ
jgi:hypothetical protein